MRKLFVLTVTVFVFFNLLLAVSIQAGLHDFSQLSVDDVKLTLKQTRTDRKDAVETEKYASDTSNSGLKGTTKAVVMSGVPGGQNTERPVSIEFAITMVKDDKPEYHKAIFVRSDQNGQYKIALVPGRYWIGPKAKALDPIGYIPTDASFSEKIAIVKQGVFTQIDLSEFRYAP